MDNLEEVEVVNKDLNQANNQLQEIINEKDEIIRQKDECISNLNKQIDWYEAIIEGYINLSKVVK